MSKLNLRLSYKNACILKHKLRNSIAATEEFILKYAGDKEEGFGKIKKELEEEKRALVAITDEIKLEMSRHA